MLDHRARPSQTSLQTPSRYDCATRYDTPARSPCCSIGQISDLAGDIGRAKVAGMAVGELRSYAEDDTNRHLAVAGAVRTQ
jgi:hypothetical protein